MTMTMIVRQTLHTLITAIAIIMMMMMGMMARLHEAIHTCAKLVCMQGVCVPSRRRKQPQRAQLLQAHSLSYPAGVP